MKALEENVEIAKKVGECPVQHTERIKYKLIEKGAFFIILWFFQRYTYGVLQTIQIKLILLCVWAEAAVLGSTKSASKFKYEI